MSAHFVIRHRGATDTPATALVPRRSNLSVRLSGVSMRFLEMSLALAAIATALLLGVGR